MLLESENLIGIPFNYLFVRRTWGIRRERDLESGKVHRAAGTITSLPCAPLDANPVF